MRNPHATLAQFIYLHKSGADIHCQESHWVPPLLTATTHVGIQRYLILNDYDYRRVLKDDAEAKLTQILSADRYCALKLFHSRQAIVKSTGFRKVVQPVFREILKYL